MGTVTVDNIHITRFCRHETPDWVGALYQELWHFEGAVLGAVEDTIAQLLFSQVIESVAEQVSSQVWIMHLKK